MARRTSRRRASERSNSRLWIVVVVAVVAVGMVGLLIALSAKPSVAVQVADGNYEELNQEVIQLNDAPGIALGNPDAPMTLVDYSDFSCPHCADLAELSIHPLIDEYVRSGDLRIIYKPISFVNPPYSRPAAQAFLCAADQGRGWEMHDQIWGLYQASGPGAYTQRNLVDQAEALGLDADEFRSCFVDPDTNQAVQAVLSEAQVIGVTGTPTLFLNGQQVGYRGAQAVYGDIKLIIDQNLGG